MAKKHWTYFNDDFKHRKVDEFCAWYLRGNSVKVDIMKSIMVDAKEELRLAEPAPPPVYRTADERAYWETRGLNLQRQTEELSPLAKLFKKVPDERFNDLKALVHRYAGIGKTVDEGKDALIQELWTLVALLEEENRIDEGKGFRMEPFNEMEMARLVAKLENLEARYENTVKFLRENNAAFISWEKRQPKQ